MSSTPRRSFRRGHRGDAPHRPGGGRRLHRPGATTSAFDRHAGRSGRHGPEHQTCSRRTAPSSVSSGRSWGPRWAWWRGCLPAARRVELPPPDRRFYPAVGGDHPEHDRRHRGHVPGRLAAGPVDHQSAHRDCTLRPARPIPGRSIVRPSPASSSWCSPSSCWSYAGSMRRGGGAPEVIFGLVSLIVALILLSPLSLTALAKVTRRTPIAVRLAVRDLARYRARSGSALSAISLGVLIAVLVCVLAAAATGMSSTTPGPIWPRTSWSSTRPTLALDRASPAADPRARRRRVCRQWRRARTTWERLLARKTWLRSSQRTPTSSMRPAVGNSAARFTWPPRRSSRPSGSPLLRSTPRPTSSRCARGSRLSP